jgi:heme/copper-type cytochrome/quinol oxidase subunit 1
LRALSPGHATDYWALALIISGFGTLGTAVNIVATIISMRCKGMTLMRMPMFTWLLLAVSMLTLVTITPLIAAQFMLLIDRYRGGHFFDTQAGSSSSIWIHFFWIFGHPEVDVLVGIAVLIFAYNFIVSYRRGEVAGDDPWDAWILEWVISLPPRVYNFEEEPEMHSRRPLWDLKHPHDPGGEYES